MWQATAAKARIQQGDTASAQPTPDPNTDVQEADQIEIDEEMEDGVVAEEQNGMYNNNISAQLM